MKLTEENKQYIIDHYQTDTVVAIAKAINQNERTISSFMRANGLSGKKRVFTDAEKAYIINNYPTRQAKEIAKTLGCSTGGIHGFAKVHHLKKTVRIYNTGKNWTPEEVDYLIKNYRDSAVSDLMAKLGKTKWAITSKKLALKKQGLIQ